MTKKFETNVTRKKKKILCETVLVFVIVSFVTGLFSHVLTQYEKRESMLTASSAAEDIVRKIEIQVSKYMENSDLFKNIISSGDILDHEQFSRLASAMIHDEEIVEAYELAPNGIVTEAYPLEGNEKAIGMNMLELPERKTEALLAKESETYTIAGPYELKQGGIGALIFDPIYMTENGEKKFWGFSIIVMNWTKFTEQLQLKSLKDTGYYFNVWKKDHNDNRVNIMNHVDMAGMETLTVRCPVPNDTWYLEIIPETGWISLNTRVLSVTLCVLISLLITVLFCQMRKQNLKEEIYAGKIAFAAQKAENASLAKTRFLFNMSHDIRTPMNAIIGYTNLLENHLDDKKTALNYIHKLQSANSILLSLINYTLEMARIESGKLELREEHGSIHKLVNIMKSVTDPLTEEKNLNVRWNVDIRDDDVICDITKLREIILNIISNAIKYTPEGGNISIDITEKCEEGSDSALYCFVISDTGIGMSAEYLPHIFEEFSREHTSTESRVAGAGLGLPIVRSLVDLMKGTIGVESEEGKGTAFRVELPFPLYKESEKEEKHVLSESELRKLQGCRILLAEDNELNTEIAVEIMKKVGIVSDCVTNGKKCLEKINEKPAGYYDAVLMDIQMPVMNGYEATAEIRKMSGKKGKIPVIALTANAFDEDRKKAIASGMNDHIAKPIDPDVLATAILKYVEIE